MADEDALQPEPLTEITDAYLRALGRITVEFSHLESTLSLGCAIMLCPDDATRAFIVVAQLSFKNLLSAFCLLLGREVSGRGDVVEATTAFRILAIKAEEERNRAAHSIWALPRSSAGRAVRRKISVTQKPIYRREVHAVSVEEVNAIADRIAEANAAGEPLLQLIRQMPRSRQ